MSSHSPMLDTSSVATSLTDKYALAADPAAWGTDLHNSEPDDHIHVPEVRDGKVVDRASFAISFQGFTNIGCLLILSLTMIGLFMGYPVVSHLTKPSTNVNSLTFNATGQVPAIGNFGLIDLDTPSNVYTIKSLKTGKDMRLVFSDEFNQDGRSFYPGDDPYWEAVDLHYWATNNMEVNTTFDIPLMKPRYDPSAITTSNGSLRITLSRERIHDLDYKGGMLSTWNKFCFTGGYLVASVVLPGTNNIHGLWPAFWAMGNLGRAGYGASLDSMWPYTYDTCDVGTVANQTFKGLPILATTSGDKNPPYNGELSYLGGQRLSRCTCPGESHPGPIHADGTYVGRAAPEIDVFEAQISNGAGQVSQSGQWAPFNNGYVWFNTSDNLVIANPSLSELNTYIGGAYQQATSVVTTVDQNCYELRDGCYSIYGFEYKPGFGDAYITWVSDNKIAWTLNAAGMAADPQVEIGPRAVPQEPMYILANLGMSRNFGAVDLDQLTFPTTLSIDYVRVYQYPDQINIGCDPPNFPTQDYINTYIEAYTSNPNVPSRLVSNLYYPDPELTTWVDDYKQVMPKNKFRGEC
ncbi:Glycoside hydrolase family 16 protein [Mycena indigotica]|uniref:Glycoside hydrolase family 16 protein n=1 Tax=Mycena indigotica TaxID=2126181 RepID=A0A8H6WJX9_9AGAR|nr:Glycoside hydrolase family 16 protein [Mycena indigotica]KAF7315039.1 Glycoside hydrolase family 16 protein [Mycena indigotica]